MVGDTLPIQTGTIMVINHFSVRPAPTKSSAATATEKNVLTALLHTMNAAKERCKVAKWFNAQWPWPLRSGSDMMGISKRSALM